MPWAPQSKEEALEVEKMRHPGARPSGFQEYLKDPEGYEAYQETLKAGKVPPLTMEDRMKLQENAARQRARFRAPKEPKEYAPASPDAQFKAEAYAREQVLREHPEFKNFIVSEKQGTRTVRRMKRADELPKAGGGLFSRTTQTQESIARDQYNQFLQEVERRKKAILGRRGGAQPTWEIQRED